MTWRDIKVRYKQTVLGTAWAIIKPFLPKGHAVTMIVGSDSLGGWQASRQLAFPTRYLAMPSALRLPLVGKIVEVCLQTGDLKSVILGKTRLRIENDSSTQPPDAF